MEFYVPLGGRGVLFRLGTLWIGLIGGVVYERARRRRVDLHDNPVFPLRLAEIMALD